MGTWRDSAKKYINNVIMENPGISENEMRRKLREAYPWGQRAMHPYKIWCDEVKKTMRKLYPGKGEINIGLFNQQELCR